MVTIFNFYSSNEFLHIENGFKKKYMKEKIINLCLTININLNKLEIF
jgi:hypothetical protein